MAINITSKDRPNRRAVAIALSTQGAQQPSRTRNAMMLLAIVALGSTIASHAFAAGRMGDSFGASSGYHGDHVRSGFHGSIIDSAPSAPAPTFNPSDPYTVPEAPETPVSPASPGSVFGNGASLLLVSAIAVKPAQWPSAHHAYRLEQRGYYGTPYGGGPQYGNGGGDQYGYGPGYSYARQAPDMAN
jgi:hypothetical protein